MKSRYDFIKASEYTDETTGELWPDPISLNFYKFEITDGVEAVELTSSDISSFWYLIHKKYGTSEYDDIVLSLNNVAHKNFLKEGDVIYIPAKSDIERSFKL